MAHAMLRGTEVDYVTHTLPMVYSGWTAVAIPDGLQVDRGWHYINGQWLDETQAPQIISTMTLAEAKAAKWAQITAACDAALAPLATEYGVYERATWDQQSAEAKALAANPEADAPLVRAMATARGIDAVELAGRILGHEARWKAIAGEVIGQGQKLWDQVDAATTVEGVQAVEVVYSLPEA